MAKIEIPRGLKRMRLNRTDKKPKHPCDNCRCMRYSPCGCVKKKSRRQP